MKGILHGFAVAVAILLTCGATCVAQDEYDKFPKSGLLAAAGSLPPGSISVPQLPMGLTGLPVPLLGSVSQNADRNWSFGVENKTAREIKVSLDFAQYNARRDRISTKSYTYKLKAGASAGEKISGDREAAGATLILNNWSWVK